MAPRQRMHPVDMERPWRTCNYPVLSRDEATGADGDIGELEGFDDGLEGRQFRWKYRECESVLGLTCDS